MVARSGAIEQFHELGANEPAASSTRFWSKSERVQNFPLCMDFFRWGIIWQGIVSSLSLGRPASVMGGSAVRRLGWTYSESTPS